MRKLPVCLFPLLFSTLLHAAPVDPGVRAEIDALMSALQASGCEFNRNGSWHSAPEARKHLLQKLDYLEGKNAVQKTEQFIELGASTSSSSGKPYLVRCGNQATVESNKWLTAKLATIRSSGRAAAAPVK